MHPVHKCIDSFPHQHNQMPCDQHYYPRFEAFAPMTKVDTSTPPLPYGTWPYGGNYGYSVPVGCHGCCSHSNFPGYGGFRPPYPCYPPPQQVHYHGGYPPLPETYPVHYVPSPNYSMGQPRYEYDKNVPGDHHCCGFPNHLCNRKEDRGVKIEEHEPELDKGTSGGKTSSNSLVPVDFRNQAYPIAWIPPGYMGKEPKNLNEPKSKGGDEYSRDTKANENLKPFEMEPSVRNGWFPFDVNSFGSLNNCKDGKRPNQPKEERNQFPFPMFWMPHKPQDEEKGDHAEANTGRVSDKKSVPLLMPTSAKFSGGDDSTSQPLASEAKIGSYDGSKSLEKKHATVKIIPVKQVEEHEEKMTTEGDEVKARGLTVMEKEGSKEKKPSENVAKRQSSSPSKASKLPPVCLRVDPFPKRKNGSNGSSRSPSPPGKKGKSIDSFGEREMNETERKVLGIPGQDSSDDYKFRSQPQVPVSRPINSAEQVLKRQATEEKKSGGVIEPTNEVIKEQSRESRLHPIQEDKGATEVKEENLEEAKKAKRKKLSEAEAAVVIQSVFRGFEVRRWEPLKKMKQIAEVSEQAAEVRRRVEALETSTDIISDKRQRVVIGETIMSLLLKLDTIQGLHPSVRDFRKSVVKELVSLQEKLDSLTSKISEVPTSESVQDCSRDTSIQGDPKEAEVGFENITGERDQDNDPSSVEPCQGQVSHVKELTTDYQSVEASDLKSDEKEVCNEPQDNMTEGEAVKKLEDGVSAEVLDDGQVTMVETQAEDIDLKPAVEPLPSVPEEKVDSTEEMRLPSCTGDQSAELSGTSDRALDIEDLQETEEIRTGKSGITGGEVGSLLDGEIGDANQVHQEEQVVVDVEDGEREEIFEPHEDVEVEKVKPLGKKQGEEVNRITDHVEVKDVEEEFSLKEGEPLEDTGLEVGEEPTVQTQGPQPELLLVHEEMHDGEDSKLEEFLPEPLPLPNEIQGGEHMEDVGMTSDAGNSWEEKEVPIEEVTQECKMESEITTGEENQEVVDGGHEPEGLESVTGNDEVIATQFAPAGADRREAEGESVPMSPGALSHVSVVSEMGSGNDRKLLEENEKLREMMEKLIEAGREQITAMSNLSGRVKDLEKKLARKNNPRTRRVRAVSSRGKSSNEELKGRAHGAAL